MRAVTLRDGALVLEEQPTPEPAGDRVLVEVAGGGLNRADLLQMMGAYPAPPGWPADIPGLEFAGTVAGAGRHVTGLKEGDRVFGIVGGGGQATHVLVPESLCALVPDGLDTVEAGGIPEVFITAHDALVRLAGLRPGERVLIHAVGSGVGTAALQLAIALGASTVGTSRTEGKLERAKELGLDEAVVAGDDMVNSIGEVDVVIDLVGGDYLRTDVEVCRPKGRIVIVGLLAGPSSTLDMGAALRKRLTVVGTTLRGRPDYEKALATAAFDKEVVPWLARGDVRLVLDRVFDLDQASDAYEYMASNEGFGKVVLKAVS